MISLISLNKKSFLQYFSLSKLKKFEKRSRKKWIAALANGFCGSLRGSELVRRVGPGKIPLEEHEWKTSHTQESLR